MEMVLIDTNIWSHYWKGQNQQIVATVESLIYFGNVACCLPIIAELASAQIKPAYLKTILSSLDHAIKVDIDYSCQDVWLEAAKIANHAYQKKLPPCSLIDRLILLSAIKAEIKLWTLDKNLAKLAQSFHISFVPN